MHPCTPDSACRQQRQPQPNRRVDASTDAATHHPPRPTLDWPRQSMWYTRGHASHMTTSPPSPHMMHEYSHWLPSSSAAIAESHSSSPPAAVSSAGSAAAAAAPSAFGDVTSSDPAAAAGSSGGGGSGSCTSYGIRRSAANQSSCLQGQVKLSGTAWCRESFARTCSASPRSAGGKTNPQAPWACQTSLVESAEREREGMTTSFVTT